MDLERRAKRGVIEVEHVIAAAAMREPSVVAQLERLSRTQSWLEVGEARAGRDVPMATWARLAVIFVQHGQDGLVAAAAGEAGPTRDAPFVLSFLESYKTSASVRAVVQLVGRFEGYWTTALRTKVASAANLLLSFKDAAWADESARTVLRDFLHQTLAEQLSPAERSTALCALRGVGNEESVRLLENEMDLPSPWHEVVGKVRRRLKRRLATQADGDG